MGLTPRSNAPASDRKGSRDPIAQEFAISANGFAKEAGALMERSKSRLYRLAGRRDRGGTAFRPEEGTKRCDSRSPRLRRMGETLDVAVADLERDSKRVETAARGIGHDAACAK